MTEFYTPPQGLGTYQPVDLGAHFMRGAEFAQKSQLNQLQQEESRQSLEANRQKLAQSQALQDMKMKAAQGDAGAVAVVSRLDPEYGKQLMDLQDKKIVHYGTQAKAITTLPLEMRSKAYESLYTNAKQAGEDVSMYPLPTGDWSDLKQSALEYAANATIEPLKRIELAQKDRQLDIESIKNKNAAEGAGGATGVIINMLMEENPNLTVSDALFQVQTGNRIGVRSEGGIVTPIGGLAEAKKTYKSAEAEGKAIGKDIGEEIASLRTQEATFPQLLDTVGKLHKLGQAATYTTTGRAANFIRKEAGMPPQEGAIKRAEYIALVDNQILPLLRQTFGAQFTQKEGESLKITLGDPNKSPAEKDAVLRAFIQQKRANIESSERKLGVSSESGNRKPLGDIFK